jgi:hypothetical protein
MAGTRTLVSLTALLKLNNSAFKKGLGNSKKELNKFGKSVKNIGGVLAGAFTTRALVNFTAEAVKLASVMEGVERAFMRIQPSVDFMNQLQDATAGTVSELQLMRRAVMASNFNIPLKELSSLLEFATKRAQETGESVDFLVNSIVIGIGRKSPLILDNLGISAVQLRQKLDNVGHSGATVGDVAKAVGEIATEAMKEMGGVADTTAIKLERLTAKWTDLKTEIGEFLLSGTTGRAFKGAMDDLTRLFDFLNRGDAIPGGAVEFLNSLKDKDPAEQTRLLQERITGLRKSLEDLAKKRRAIQDSIDESRGAERRQFKEDLDNINTIQEAQLTYLRAYERQLGLVGTKQKEVSDLSVDNITNMKAELAELQKIFDATDASDVATLKAIADEMNRIREQIEKIQMIGKEHPLFDPDTMEGVFKELERIGKTLKPFEEKGVFSSFFGDDEVWEGGKEAWEDIAEKMEQAEKITDKLKKAVGVELVSSFFTLGNAVGEALTGVTDSLKKLAITIAQNLGYILMMAGLEMLAVNPAAGAGLIVAGGVLQLGSGLIRGLGSSVGNTGGGPFGGDHTFRIEGKDLVTVLERQTYSDNLNT